MMMMMLMMVILMMKMLTMCLSPLAVYGSECAEMRKRQIQVYQEAAASVVQARHRMGETPTNASNACCFCWCCCCSCSW